MADRIRAHDWAATPLGPVATWPPRLLAAVELMLASGHAMQLAWGPQRTVLYNDAYAPMLGTRHPRALGATFPEAWPDIWPEIEPLVERVFAGETVTRPEMPLVMNRQGYREETWWSFSYSPVRDETGAVAGLLNVCVDGTGRHRAAAAEHERDVANERLQENEQRFRALVTAGAQSIYRMSPDWRLMHQLDSQTLANTTAPILDWVEKYILPEDLPAVKAAIDTAIRDKAVFELEHRVRLADDRTGWVLSRAVPLLGADGEITEWFGSASDVTVRRQAVERLRDSQQAYRSLFENMDQGYLLADVLFDAAGRAVDIAYVDSNPAAVRMVGTDLTGRRLTDVAPDYEPYWYEIWGRVALTGRGERLQRFAAPEGRWYDFYVFKPDPADRDSRRVAVLFQDITERKEQEFHQDFVVSLSDALRPLGDPAEVLRVAMQMLRERLDAARAVFVAVGPDGEAGQVEAEEHRPGIAPLPGHFFRLSSMGAARAGGLAGGQPMRVADVATLALPAAEREACEAAGARAWIVVPLRRDGRLAALVAVVSEQPRAWTTAQARVLDDAAERTWAAAERARTTTALRESENSLRLALAAASMGTWHWEVEANRHRRDANLNRLLGLEAVETVRPIEEFFEHVHADDRGRVRSAFEESVRHGRNMQVDFRVVRPDGQVLWLSDRGDAFGTGSTRYLAGACVDITQRKRLEEELREADRRKDEFLAMLGHELRNPLAPLSNLVGALKRPNVDPATRDRAYTMMERQVGHLSRLVHDLLDVSRITLGVIELRQEPLNLAEVAEQAVEMAMPAVERQGHELVLSMPRKALPVQGDKARLTQVIFNLLHNAAKYTSAGGRIWLTLEREDGHVSVCVRDDGSGMSADLVPRVFDLFTQGDRTMDRSQGGLGLGLALVKRLVAMHGGTVSASSEGPGRGSAFVVRLPTLQASALAPEPVAAPPADAGIAVARALVIDDVPDIADSCAWLLDGLVREVNVAYSGAKGLELAGAWKPDLVICDVGMPGMDGYETCRRLRALPGAEATVIVAASGYGGDEFERASARAGFDRHLVKPISREALAGLVELVHVR